MGTRGAFGVIIGETEKISYNHFDSYPDGHGIENLRWLREVVETGLIGEVREQALACRLVDEDTKPTPEDIVALDIDVSKQETNGPWYWPLRDTQGSIAKMLGCGYMIDNSGFPLDGLFCEWAYLVDFDAGTFEAYKGGQKTLPEKGRWAGRPNDADNEADYAAHVKWCKEHGRDPFHPKVPEYKAVELVASWPLDALPTDDEFLRDTQAYVWSEEDISSFEEHYGIKVSANLDTVLDKMAEYNGMKNVYDATKDEFVCTGLPAKVVSQS